MQAPILKHFLTFTPLKDQLFLEKLKGETTTSKSKEFTESTLKQLLEVEGEATPLVNYYVLNHADITLDYEVYYYDELLKITDINELYAAVRGLHFISGLAEKIYPTYLGVKNEGDKFHEDKEFFAAWLKNTTLLPKLNPIKESTSSLIRKTTTNANPPRLLYVIRFRRFLTALGLYIGGEFGHFTAQYDLMTRPFILFQGLVFFVTRLAWNFFNLIKHTLLFPFMTREEKTLSWHTRFLAHLDRRIYELLSDLNWFINGVLALIGKIVPFFAFVNMITTFLDATFNGFRLFKMDHSLKKLIKQYQILEYENTERLNNILATSPYNSDLIKDIQLENNSIHRHIEALQKRLLQINKLNILGLVNAIAIFLCTCMLCFTATPIIPLIGAGLIVLLTLTNIMARNAIATQKSAACSFFSHRKKAKSIETNKPPKDNKFLHNLAECTHNFFIGNTKPIEIRNEKIRLHLNRNRYTKGDSEKKGTNLTTKSTNDVFNTLNLTYEYK